MRWTMLAVVAVNLAFAALAAAAPSTEFSTAFAGGGTDPLVLAQVPNEALPHAGRVARPFPMRPDVPISPDTACACKRASVMRWTLDARLKDWANGFWEGLPAFLVSEAAFAVVLFISSYLMGLGVRRRGWNPSYTRKLIAVVLLATPLLMQSALPIPQTPFVVVAGFLFGLIYLALNAESLRRASPFLDVGFAAMDRPEDRPHTLAWLMTSYVVSSLILMAMIWGLPAAQSAFVIVAIVATGLGDTLAGAVGVRFGRHHYKTWALFTKKTYTRSYEGSACMFAVTAICVWWLGGAFGPAFWPALLILPPVLTLAEAQSPHTWDEPAVVAACGLGALFISAFAPTCSC